MSTHLNYSQYFMGVAMLSSKRSKDPSTQVGAVIVTPDNRIIGAGWNGMPNVADNDKSFPWGKDSPNPVENKYMYVVHAEPNAICHASESVRGCTMYLTWFPCAECAKSIVQSGISKIVYLHKHTTDRYQDSMEAARRIFDSCGVTYKKYSEKNVSIKIEFK